MHTSDKFPKFHNIFIEYYFQETLKLAQACARPFQLNVCLAKTKPRIEQTAIL